MENNCPKTEKCPLFNDNLLRRAESASTYKKLYCTAGESKWKKCKRYMVSEATGKCPDFVMPNSTYTVEEIKERMKKEKML